MYFYFISPDGRYLLLPYDFFPALQDTARKARYKMYDLDEGVEVDFPNSEEPGIKGGIMDYCGWRGTTGSILVSCISF